MMIIPPRSIYSGKFNAAEYSSQREKNESRRVPI